MGFYTPLLVCTIIFLMALFWLWILVWTHPYLLRRRNKIIQKELEACRAAFAANPDAKSAWCIHHDVLWEGLTEPYEDRIQYILHNKPIYEQATRFRNFRPCSQHQEVRQQWYMYWDFMGLGGMPSLKDLPTKIVDCYRRDVPNGTYKEGSIF